MCLMYHMNIWFPIRNENAMKEQFFPTIQNVNGLDGVRQVFAKYPAYRLYIELIVLMMYAVHTDIIDTQFNHFSH